MNTPPSAGADDSGRPPLNSVDAQHPWLGLISFTEENRQYFYGREEEVAELGRRVQRKLLTVLFGQSGLGKTSILQAGLVPRLRPEGFCPVYVRIDYDRASPPPAEQIKRAVFQATAASGSWTRTGAAVAGESLWEFLHHRDDVLKDAAGRTLTPLLIFDQFEEIFTLAQTDDAGRQRAQEFLRDLADLVENRPPAALEERIERDEADAAKFDFARADYRVLLSLREDYLAHLEALKDRMPSVTQNRMRLARMTGAQAVAAVRRPAAHLVSEPVAEAVVRFVAGGTELGHAEVEPSLLSLICRELNEARLARGQSEISADLLAGSRDTILSEFYERTLVDQPSGVRAFIEDEMLTDSGFRESVAEERVRKGFAAAGAGPGALALLVDRRLLRVEDRLDLRRVEITHDVLCSVVAASRAVRHEREALEASKRELAVRQASELATRRALMRARLVAAVCAVLMIAAAASAIFGWVNLRRARSADVQTQAARRLAEQARGQSEQLVAYLLEDFYEELMPTGGVEIVQGLADKAVAYYDQLPPELMTRETKTFQGMALMRRATALRDGGRMADAQATSQRAQALFARLRAEGDDGEDVRTGLALAIFAGTTVAGLGDDRAQLQTAVGLLRPIVQHGHATRGAKLAFGDMLQYLAHAEADAEAGLRLCEESRQVLAAMGALTLQDLTAASIYGDVTDSESRIALRLGRTDEAERLSRICADIADKVLQQRPADLRSLRNRYFAMNAQGLVAAIRHDLATARARFEASQQLADDYTRFNPADSIGWELFADAYTQSSRVAFAQGRIAEAIAADRRARALADDPHNHVGVVPMIFFGSAAVADFEALRGNATEARGALEEVRRLGVRWATKRNFDAELTTLTQVTAEMPELQLLASQSKFGAIAAQAQQLERKVDAIPEHTEGNVDIRRSLLANLEDWQAQAALKTGHYAAALEFVHAAQTHIRVGRWMSASDVEGTLVRNKVREAEALLALGRSAEAVELLTSAMKYYRAQAAAGATETLFRQDFARALYQMARAQSEPGGATRRRELLGEADQVLSGLSAEARQLTTSQDLLSLIHGAQSVSDGTAS